MSRILKLRCGLSELSRSQAMTSGSSDRLPLWLGDRRKASIFVRKTLRVRPRDQQCVRIGWLAGQDLRFSMKMMFAAVLDTVLQPV